jgi:acyl carrier protein
MNDQKAEVQAAVRKLVSAITELPEQEIDLDAAFVADLGADSMSALELMARIEHLYGVVVLPEYLPRFKSVNTVTELVLELLEKKAAHA